MAAHISDEEYTSRPQNQPSTSTPVTRQTSCVFGLGPAISGDDRIITGSRLPSCRQVLRCFMWHLSECPAENSKWQAATMVMLQMTSFYEKANIPLISDLKACEKVLKLVDENAKLRAIPLKRRSTPATQDTLQKSEQALDTTFIVWPHKAERMIKNKEDLLFLESMKNDRLASFGSFDKSLAGQIQRTHIRHAQEESRKLKSQEDIRSIMEKTSSNTDADDTSDSDTQVTNSVDPKSTRRHSRSVRTGTSAFVPHDILKRPKIISLATRMKMSAAEQAAFTEALVEESGGDPSKLAISYATADRSRRKVTETIAKSTREDWNVPEFATVHWDSKLMASLTNPNVSEERLTIAVGTQCETKLLGVPSYRPGTNQKTGDIIAEHTLKLLDMWHCRQSIVNMTFDTTASNTGHISAACITIQQSLGRALLWSGCRHHVGEVILSNLFNDLKIEVSKSPEVSLFIRYRKNFDLLPNKNIEDPLARLHIECESEETTQFVASMRADVLELAHLQSDFKRGDYKEFVELCVIFLSENAEQNPPVSFKRPGAMPSIWPCAKLLYSIKICLLEQEINKLPHGTVTTHHQTMKVRNFVNFVTLIYSQWWLTCSSAVNAPFYDLRLYKQFLQYEAINESVSKSAIKAFKRHMWYLTAEMVPLGLFSEVTPAEERRALADQLLAVKPEGHQTTPKERFGTGFRKPKFPGVVTASTKLGDLVGPDSWYLFQLLQLNDEFLTAEVDDWAQHGAYLQSLSHIQAINGINDCAERGVKLSSDFLSSARSEEHYQDVLQVVEQDRRLNPNLRKRKPVEDN